MSLKYFSALFLNFLNLLFLFGGNAASDAYLPLVMIQRDGQLYYPNELKNAVLSEDQKSLSNVEFSLYNLHFNQIFFCPNNSPERKNEIDRANKVLASSQKLQQQYGIAQIGESCLFKTEFKTNQPVQCTVDAVPVIYTAKEKTSEGEYTPVQCGPANTGTLFQYVYELCPPNPNLFFNRNKLYIYTKHELSIVELLRNEKLKHERKTSYPWSIDDFEYFGTKFQEDVEFYKQLAKRSRTGNEKTSELLARFIYLPQQLVPSLDMMSAILANPTFHYINARPMHEKMTELWARIEDIIRRNIDDVEKFPFQVYTGAFTISENSITTKIPDLWVKIVLLPKPEGTKWDFSLAIVMKNDNEYSESDTFLDKFCEEDHCGLFKDSNRQFEHLLKHVRCCSVSREIDDLFGSLGLHNNPMLKIPQLMRIDPMPITDVRKSIQTSKTPEV